MNTRNNQRSLRSQETIERAFVALLDTQSVEKITVQSICKLANVNRTTFYTHYTDVRDLENKIETKLSAQIEEIFKETVSAGKDLDCAFCAMFYFIKEHCVFYRVFLNYHNLPILKTILNSTSDHPEHTDSCNYHIAFFTAGVSEMARIWLNHGCRETPEEMARIIYEEYCRT